jgi:hypothetical protein
MFGKTKMQKQHNKNKKGKTKHRMFVKIQNVWRIKKNKMFVKIQNVLKKENTNFWKNKF